ncbi:hypothetical protein N9V96_02190 [Polaribacter sp.]|nr:hypothetical protein [Polaribacter sp.]
MQELQLHATGKKDHIEALKNLYKSLKFSILKNKEQKETEKSETLKTLKASFETEKRDAENNLY